MSPYDFIVIGGGTANLLVANRLPESAEVNVLVLEVSSDLVTQIFRPFVLVCRNLYDNTMIKAADRRRERALRPFHHHLS